MCERYEKEVLLGYDPLTLGVEYVLVINVKATYRNNGHSFSIKMQHLNAQERNLNAGRFTKFVDEEQPYTVEKPCLRTQHDVMDTFRQSIDWISKNVSNKWSFTINVSSVSDVSIIWMFESLSDVTLFKLTF